MELIKLLKELVAIPSVFPNEQKISNFLAKYLEEIGFTVEKVPTQKTRNNIIATYGKAKKYLAFFGHMDTVPPEKEIKNPYKAVIEGNRAAGLGTEDMKGGIAAILKTGEYAVEKKLPLKIVFSVDEEDISRGANDLCTSGLLKNIDFLIAAESGQIQNIHQPYNVCYGRKGRILFELEVIGKKAHAAESKKGKNAIDAAVHLLSEIKNMELPLHRLLGVSEIIIQSIQSESDSFVIPDKCMIKLSLLTTPQIKSSEVAEKIKNLAKKLNIKIDIRLAKRETPFCESFEVDTKNKFLKLLEKKIFIPDKVEPIYTPSVADENIFANRLKIPVISLGPIGGGGHSRDEWLDIKSLRIVEARYKEIVKLYHSTSLVDIS
jgi:acetylornithine deacetylase/succinyl-diaminopimelate desuccinylase-like protein